ncbi:MAG: TadE/TadG family type IV pilus assembly protein [Anaerolineales bacterium]
MGLVRGYLKRRQEHTWGQSLAEFALVLPIMLLLIFVIIESARLLFAWLAVENAARFGIRYAVTGDYNDSYYNVTDCNNFYSEYGLSCAATQPDREENAARILSTFDAAWAGSVGIQRDPNLNRFTDWASPGLFKVTVCSLSAASYTDPDPTNFTTDWMAECDPIDHAGNPGDHIWVVADFNHPMILPFLSNWWPYLHLTARRDGIVEQFRVARVIGAGGLPTAPPTATYTPTPTYTFTPSNTPTDTYTPSITPTPSDTPTPSNTPTASNTPTITLTPSMTLTPSNTPTPTITFTPSPTVPTNTPLPTLTPSNTPTPSDTPTPSRTPTASHTPTATRTRTATFTASITPTPSITLTPSNTPTRTATPTLHD